MLWKPDLKNVEKLYKPSPSLPFPFILSLKKTGLLPGPDLSQPFSKEGPFTYLDICFLYVPMLILSIFLCFQYVMASLCPMSSVNEVLFLFETLGSAANCMMSIIFIFIISSVTHNIRQQMLIGNDNITVINKTYFGPN